MSRASCEKQNKKKDLIKDLNAEEKNSMKGVNIDFNLQLSVNY